MRRIVAALAVALALAAVVSPAAAVHRTGSSFTVELAENGDATVVVQDTYDLSNESQRQAFEALQGNESRQQERKEAFAGRLSRGADLARNATGRDVQAGEVSVNLTETDDRGVFRLEGSWTAIAAVNTRHNILELRQPFQSGFDVNRTLVVVGPEDYTRAGTNPSPSRALRRSVYWGHDANFSEFFVRFEGPAPSPTSTPSEGRTATVAPVTGTGLSALSSAVVLALVPAVLVVLALRRAAR